MQAKIIFMSTMFVTLGFFFSLTFLDENEHVKVNISREIANRGLIDIQKSKKFNKTTKFEKRITKLESLKDCYYKECEYPSSNPREYDLLVGQSLKTELLALYEDTLNRNRRDKRLSEISREFLKISDGHVKEAALFLLSTQEPTPENLNAILESIMNYHDANLIALALMELEKYQGAQYQVQLYENFKSNLKTGSIFVKEALARGIDQFVTLDTRGDFEDLLNEMPLNSRVRQNLKSSLDRFDHSPIR